MKFTTISILMICTGIFQKIIVQILFIKINKKKEKKNEKLLSIDVVLSQLKKSKRMNDFFSKTLKEKSNN